jgi:5-methylcytosine-specific restriction endonuclease McrA
LKKLENQICGEKHHFWKGGISFGPYSPDFNNKLKRKIKIRDNYTCLICGKETQKLAVHHINYDKLNSNEQNLISLCYSCHSKTNSNREHWIKFFESIMNEKYVNMSKNNNGIKIDKLL